MGPQVAWAFTPHRILPADRHESALQSLPPPLRIEVHRRVTKSFSLFLLALLLPSVLQREAGEWRGVEALRLALMNVLRVIKAFTLPPSLTLSLATCGVVELPARFTEPAIAFSGALAAANNLKPVVRERGWVVAFIFGLLISAYLLNATQPASSSVQITAQKRNEKQSVGAIVFNFHPPPSAFGIRETIASAGGLLCAALLTGVWRRTRHRDASAQAAGRNSP